jgi:hypothetical protein
MNRSSSIHPQPRTKRLPNMIDRPNGLEDRPLRASRSVPLELEALNKLCRKRSVPKVKRSLSGAKPICGVLFESRRMRDAHIRHFKNTEAPIF